MTRTFAFTAFATVLTLTTAPAAQAGNAGQSLPACYNHVISACNQTNHPESCAEAGMNACDEYHAAHAAVPGMQIKIFDHGGGTFKAKLVLPQSEPVDPKPGNDDDRRKDRKKDRDTDTGRDEGRTTGVETRDPTGGRG